MHDEAPPHFSRVARQFLNQRFANKWIGSGGPIARPARSPDLNPLDFHLWGHLKSIAYTTSIENAEILRNRTEQGIELPTNSRNSRNDRESNQINDKTRAGLSSNARWSFRASFVKVIKTENSLYLINEDR